MNKITKIIELLIDWDTQDVEDVGVEIMSMVNAPAIGVSWQAFTAQHFVEKVAGETKDDYISRCMPVLIAEGYESDQAAAICYGSFSEDEEHEQRDDTEMINGVIDLLNKVEDLDNRKKMAQDVMNDFELEGVVYDRVDFLQRIGIEEVLDILDIIQDDNFGQTLDADNTVWVDFTKENFNTVTDFLQGLLGLDIAGRRDATETPEIRYMYAGPSSDRPFCAAMLRLNKVYTRDELHTMGSTVGNGIDQGPDAISKWHGGPNCRHFFTRVNIIKDGNRTLVTNLGPDNEFGIPMDTRPLGGFKNASTKAKADQWYAIQRSYGRFTDMQFAADDEQMIITGPAMKAFQMIPRKDEDGNMYHVYFSDETVKKISQKFLAENKQHNTDIEHSMIASEENTLIESWIVEDPENDKANALGFKPSKSDWYVSYKINNRDTWEKIKSGELNGFSISGQFIEKLA